MYFSPSSLTNAPCSTCEQPAFAAASTASARVRVHQRPQSLRLRLAAGRRQLRIGHRLRAALANALRGEDLDQVRARLFLFPHVLTQLIRRAGALVHRAERRQDARAGQHAARDRVAKLLVAGGADALHGREAVHQRHPRVLGGEERHLRGRLAAILRAPVLAEVIADVDVHVDEPGHQRDVAEVVGHRARALIDFDDRAALDLDRGVGQRAALAVEHAGGADRDGLILRGNPRDRGEQRSSGKSRENGEATKNAQHVSPHWRMWVSHGRRRVSP